MASRRFETVFIIVLPEATTAALTVPLTLLLAFVLLATMFVRSERVERLEAALSSPGTTVA